MDQRHKDSSKKEKNLDIEKIPRETRKAILAIVILLIMLTMLVTWAYSIKKLFSPDNELLQKTELEGITDNLNSIFQEAKTGFELTKNKVEEIINTDKITDRISEEDLMQIKEKIILKETENWQNHKDEDNKFEIKYPNHLDIILGDVLIIADTLDNENPKKIIEIKKFDSLVDMENNNEEVKKYIEQKNYFLAAIDLEKTTTSDLIIETFKILQ